MSEMSLQIAIRFKQPSMPRNALLLEYLRTIFGKEPDDIEEYDDKIEYIEYRSENNDGFTVHLTGENGFYIDYMLSNERECYDINLDVTQSKLDEVIQSAKNKGIDVSDYKLKILYFYNGGCAGLAEVE